MLFLLLLLLLTALPRREAPSESAVLAAKAGSIIPTKAMTETAVTVVKETILIDLES